MIKKCMEVHLKHGKVTQIMHGASINYRYVWDVSGGNNTSPSLMFLSLKLDIRGLNPQSSIPLPLGVAINHLAKVKYVNGEHARITQELKCKREEPNILLITI